ncbi:MAG: DUF4402 domain-containing protein [Gemmatimonas sp.]
MIALNTTSRRSRLSTLAFAGALLLVVAPSAQAQQSANASVTADVQQPITVTKTHDLVFGTVFPGLNKVIAVTDAAAASFSIAGQASSNVNLTFTLPSTISSSGNTLPIANWTARSNSTASSASGTDFTPSASATSATLSGSGALHIFVGATAQPSASQVAGSYSGTLTLTVVYF